MIPSDRIGTLTTQLSVSTPQFSSLSASAGMAMGNDGRTASTRIPRLETAVERLPLEDPRNTLREPDPLALDNLRRTDDAFFVKVSYLFRALGAR